MTTERPDVESRLEHRLRLLEDRGAIVDLITEYARRLDTRDLVGYSELFTEDGQWSGRMGSARGRAAIVELLQRELVHPDDESGETRHLVFNPAVDVDGDEAQARSGFAHVERDEHDRPVVGLVGHYDDRLVRTAQGWRFASRRAFGDIPWTGTRTP